jgi:DNA-directed RNA polymerase specialized sigma24 family protein
MLQPMHYFEERATPYPTVADFLRTFNEEMHSLYLLSFLLTADHDKAEECLVSAMGECVEGIGHFMDWARSWTRAAVLKHAIQMIKPAPEHTDHVSFVSLKRSATQAESNPFAAILLLDPFERFIFVMSILEEQSDEECATLLRCSRRDVMMARLLALKRQLGTDALAQEILQS